MTASAPSVKAFSTRRGWLPGANSMERKRDTGSSPQLWPGGLDAQMMPSRSEEHTSEIQSLMRISYAVFCLKKKKTNMQCSSLIDIEYATELNKINTTCTHYHHQHHYIT